MEKPKLSKGLHEELKHHSKKDKKRRLVANGLILLTVAAFIILAKVFIFKGSIKINDGGTKTPEEKRENQPEVKDEGVVTETRSEEHTSELQSHSFISYAVFCLKKKKKDIKKQPSDNLNTHIL